MLPCSLASYWLNQRWRKCGESIQFMELDTRGTTWLCKYSLDFPSRAGSRMRMLLFSGPGKVYLSPVEFREFEWMWAISPNFGVRILQRHWNSVWSRIWYDSNYSSVSEWSYYWPGVELILFHFIPVLFWRSLFWRGMHENGKRMNKSGQNWIIYNLIPGSLFTRTPGLEMSDYTRVTRERKRETLLSRIKVIYMGSRIWKARISFGLVSRLGFGWLTWLKQSINECGISKSCPTISNQVPGKLCKFVNPLTFMPKSPIRFLLDDWIGNQVKGNELNLNS